MRIPANQSVPMEAACEDFSSVARMVDRNGMAVIEENHQPRYVLMDFAAYEAIVAPPQTREEKIAAVADAILEENMEAFLELAK